MLTVSQSSNRIAGLSPGRAVAAVIVAGTAIRLVMAMALGLGIDESYMVAAGRSLQLGYFDHPPLSWWLSSGIAQLSGSEAPWVVRSPFILLFALSTWLMFRLAAAIVGKRAGVLAAALLNLSPVFGITSGGWVLPDGPLDCALLAAAVCLVHALPRHSAWSWWMGAGAAAGCALLAKYSAALTLLGALLYLLSQPAHRQWLARPQPYLAALVAGMLFTPSLIWNAQHGWASLAFQAGRTSAEAWRSWGPLIVLGGEALFLLPWIWLPMVMAASRAVLAGPADWRRWLLVCLGAGPVVLFAVVGLWSRHVLFHWAAPGYLFWFPLLGAEVERVFAVRPRLVRGVFAGTCGLLIVSLATLGSEVHWHWLPDSIAASRDGVDPELQAVDWSPLRTELAVRGLLERTGTVIGTLGWQDAGKVAYALAGRAVICMNRDARQFGLSGAPIPPDGTDVLIVSTKPVNAAALAEQGFAFESVVPLAPVLLAPASRPGLQLRLSLARRLTAAR